VRRSRKSTVGLAVVLTLLLLAGIALAACPPWTSALRTQYVAYFDNSTGIYPGDDVLILGVKVGSVDTIEPQPQHARITFSVDSRYGFPRTSTPPSSLRSWSPHAQSS
jgi:phospholipid/cholesterol/gamma-HCH transport system substrate-binding protein